MTNNLTYFKTLLKNLVIPKTTGLCMSKVWNYMKNKLLEKYNIVNNFSYINIVLMLINRCNLNCEYCGATRDGLFKEKKMEIDINFIENIFSKPIIGNSLLVSLLGGEPLLCKDIVEIVSFLSKNGHLSNLFTNGILLRDKIEDLKKAGLTSINLSIYPESMSYLKNTLLDINKIFPVRSSYVLIKSELERNNNYIFDLIEFTKKSRCKNIIFWRFGPQGKNPNYEEIVSDDLPSYKNFVYEAKRKYGNYVYFTGSQVSEKGKNEDEIRKCKYLWEQTLINADGTIIPCCGGVPLLDNVNIISSSFNEIYNHDTIVDIRSRLLNRNLSLSQFCQNCKFFY